MGRVRVDLVRVDLVRVGLVRVGQILRGAATGYSFFPGNGTRRQVGWWLHHPTRRARRSLRDHDHGVGVAVAEGLRVVVGVAVAVVGMAVVGVMVVGRMVV